MNAKKIKAKSFHFGKYFKLYNSMKVVPDSQQWTHIDVVRFSQTKFRSGTNRNARAPRAREQHGNFPVRETLVDRISKGLVQPVATLNSRLSVEPVCAATLIASRTPLPPPPFPRRTYYNNPRPLSSLIFFLIIVDFEKFQAT